MWALSRLQSRKPTLSAGKAFRYFSTLSGKHFQQAPAITLRFFEDPRELELDVPANQNLQKVEGSWTAIDQEKLRKCITDDVDAVINGNGTQWKGWWPIQYSRRAYLYEHHHASGLVIETEIDDIPEHPKNQTPPELDPALKITRAMYDQLVNGPKTPKFSQKAILVGSSTPHIPLYNDSPESLERIFASEPNPLDEMPIDDEEAAYLAEKSREFNQETELRDDKELQEYLRQKEAEVQQPEKASNLDVAKSAALLYPQSETSPVRKFIRKAEGDQAGLLDTIEPQRFAEKPSNPDADLDVEINYHAADSDESAPKSLLDIIKADGSSSGLKSTRNSPYNGGLDDVYDAIENDDTPENEEIEAKEAQENAEHEKKLQLDKARAMVDEAIANTESEEEARATLERFSSLLKEFENPMPSYFISPQAAEGHNRFVMGQSIVPTGIPSCETFLVGEVPPEIRARASTVSILPFYYDRFGRTHFILREVEFEKSKILSEEEIKRQSLLPEVDQALDRLTSKNPILVRTVGDVQCKEAVAEEGQKPVRVLSDWTSFGQTEITNPIPFFLDEKLREQFGHSMADSDQGRAEARAVESFHLQFGRDVIGWDTLSGIVQTSLLGPSRWPFFWLEDCRHLMFLMQMPTPGTGLVGSEVNWEEWNGREVGGWKGEALKRHLSIEDNDSYDTPANLERAEQRLREKTSEMAAEWNVGIPKEDRPNLEDFFTPPTEKEKAQLRKWREDGMLGLNREIWGKDQLNTINEEEIEGEDEDDEVDSEPLPDRETAPLVKADRPDVKLRTRVRVVTLEKFVELDDLVRSQQDGTVVLPPHLRNIEKTIPFQEILLHVSKYNPYAADLPYNPF